MVRYPEVVLGVDSTNVLLVLVRELARELVLMLVLVLVLLCPW